MTVELNLAFEAVLATPEGRVYLYLCEREVRLKRAGRSLMNLRKTWDKYGVHAFFAVVAAYHEQLGLASYTPKTNGAEVNKDWCDFITYTWNRAGSNE